MQVSDRAAAMNQCQSIPALPFAHLNLRCNPFGEVELADRADLAVVDVEAYVDRLRQSNFAVQFIGEKGYGKTTHMLALLRHFPAAAYVHIGEGERPALPDSNPLFVDEIQRVPFRRRWRTFRRPAALVLGTHRDFQFELKAAGREVITVRPADALDCQRLLRILNRRIAWARRAAGPVPRVTSETAQELLGRYGSDVRAMEAALYDRFQELDGLHDV